MPGELGGCGRRASTPRSATAIHSIPGAGDISSGVVPTAGNMMDEGRRSLNMGWPLNDEAVDAACGKTAKEKGESMAVEGI